MWRSSASDLEDQRVKINILEQALTQLFLDKSTLLSAGEVGSQLEGIGQAFQGLGVRFVTRPFHSYSLRVLGIVVEGVA